MKFVSCMCWVERGKASLEPQKVRLSKSELEGLIKDEAPPDETSDDETEGEDEKVKEKSNATGENSRGLRGSAGKEEPSDTDGTDNDETGKKRKRKADNPEDRYTLDSYDQEGSEVAAKMTGIACFATPEEDPYITEKTDQDVDPDEKEDFLLKEDDNQLAVGRIRGDQYSLEVYVFNAASDDFYIHHDYPLENPPLCIAHIGRDTGEENGNFCAVGTMSSAIEIFDLDIVDTMDPAMRLGSERKGEKASKKRKKEVVEHCDAVLSLAWNRGMEHILASGSADNSVILWDLDSGEGANQLNGHKEKVQALSWHPQEPSLLLSGACDGTINLWDCNGLEVKQTWTLEKEEIEHIIWDAENPFYFLVATNEGNINFIDSRADKIVFTHEKAHEGEITSLCFHPKAGQCLLTGGEDGVVKLWKKESSGLTLVDLKAMGMGQLRCAQFCPDSPQTVAIGSTKSDYLRLWSLNSSEKAKLAFEFVDST